MRHLLNIVASALERIRSLNIGALASFAEERPFALVSRIRGRCLRPARTRRFFGRPRWMAISGGMRLGMVGALLLLAVAHPSNAQITGISYTLAPLAERIYFDKNAGLEDGTFAGGRIGFGFGEYTELSAIYLVSAGLNTNFDEFAALESENPFGMLPPRDVSARMYGAQLKFNIGRRTVFPYIALGTGILEFDPENLEESRLVYLTGAAGLQLAFGDNFSLLAQVEDLIYRYNPANSLLSPNDIADLGLNASDFEQVNVNNLAVRVGLQMYLGGRSRGELTAVDRALRNQFAHGLSGIRLQLEPIGGLVQFDEDLGYRERQRMAGILGGLDLGPYLGVRGFYWRGVKEGSFTDFDNLQAYGGEIRLRFGTIANRIIPYLILGGGYLDVLSGYDGNDLIEAVDRPFASGGVGLNVPLTNALQAHAGVRTLLVSTDASENVSDPSQITANVFYSAGIRFGLGRQTDDPDVPGIDIAEDEPLDTDAGETATALEAELARVRAQVDSLQSSLQRAVDPSVGPAERPSIGEDWITIPVPREGEFYVRYGDSGEPSRFSPGRDAVYVDPETGALVDPPEDRVESAEDDGELTADDIRDIVRETMRRELQERARPQVTERSETVERLLDRIEELEARLEQRELVPRTEIIRQRQNDRAGYDLQFVLPFAGFGFSEDQIGVAGIRAELRSRSLTGLRLLPELTASAGAEGVSYGLNAGAGFALPFEVRSLRPYTGVGLGFVTIDGTELVFNLFAGVEQTGFGGRFFAEYMSQDFFDLNRIVFGYRLSL